MAKSAYLVSNPAACRGLARRRAGAIIEILTTAGIRVEHLESSAPGDIETKVRDLAANGAGSIIIAGGDGTIHEAVNGVIAAKVNTAIGLIPAGSGNDFAKAANLDLDWRAETRNLASRISTGQSPRQVDAGRCNSRYFANGVGIGFDAIVTDFAKRVRAPIGDLVYLVGLARAMIAGIVTPELRIESDEFCYTGNATLANAANGQWLGGRFRIAPNARLEDGLLELVVALPLSRRRIVKLLPSLVQGTHIAAEEVRHARASRLSIDCNLPIPAHLDGEVQAPQEHFDIECLPGALRLL